jgi:hypothetical protein
MINQTALGYYYTPLLCSYDLQGVPFWFYPNFIVGEAQRLKIEQDALI